MRFTVACHNLHDHTGTVTLFADLIVFTEAIPERVQAAVKGTAFRASVCRRQRDLVVVWDNRIFRRDWLRPARYRKYVDGIAKVTPNRGTYTRPLVIRRKHRVKGRPHKVDVNAEHRINAAFPSQTDRGERDFRKQMWERHTAGTLATMARQEDQGRLVIGAGDVNTPPNERGYNGFHEAGHGYDRIASNVPLTDFERLSPVGSDHNRIRAVVEV